MFSIDEIIIHDDDRGSPGFDNHCQEAIKFDHHQRESSVFSANDAHRESTWFSAGENVPQTDSTEIESPIFSMNEDVIPHRESSMFSIGEELRVDAMERESTPLQQSIDYSSKNGEVECLSPG